ncbi:tRNA wybutosine-synthesizing protein 5-like [Babylonia areolata]|uniref:tRNA wybutosine-synthesizing protein 5-like n=1 Tax=Babylonia areolata TaxID=304850 RepID=UPI003FD0B2B8
MYRMLPYVLYFIPVLTSGRADVPHSQNAEVTTGDKMKGHLQPFGMSGPSLQIEEKTEFPAPADFFANYVQRYKPLKLSGVARNSRAVRLWTDDYLLSLDVPADSVVQLETMKKEDRQQGTEEMHFHQFLKIYNATEHYIVDDVPAYLRPDVMVPCSIQHKELLENSMALVMLWFSSGGTKSVIHTDSFDNIICVIRGEKAFVMVDPARDRDKIKLHYDGAYSDIDVDSVDLTKYPAVGEIEFYHVNLTAGDCLYIPYKWIHQVRSYNSNVAVNFWWNHYDSKTLDHVQAGQEQCNHNLSLDQVVLHGTDTLAGSYENLRDWIAEIAKSKPVIVEDLAQALSDDFFQDSPTEAEDMAKELFKLMDLNKDGMLPKEENDKIPVETWQKIQKRVFSQLKILAAKEEDDEGQMEEPRDEL